MPRFILAITAAISIAVVLSGCGKLPRKEKAGDSDLPTEFSTDAN